MPSSLPVPVKVGSQLAKLLWKMHKGDSLGPQKQDFHFDWLISLQSAVKGQEELIRRLQQDVERLGILGNYGTEANREPTAERRQMLSNAAAALILHDEIATDRHAIVERTLRQLGPGDLELLRALDECQTRREQFERFGGVSIAAAMEEDLVDERGLPKGDLLGLVTLDGGHLGGTLLKAAGCVEVSPTSTFGSNQGMQMQVAEESVQITPLGSLLLDFLGREM